MVDDDVEDGQHPVQRKGLRAQKLGRAFVRAHSGEILPLFDPAAVLDEEPLVRLRRVVGRQVGRDQKELGIKRKLNAQPRRSD